MTDPFQDGLILFSFSRFCKLIWSLLQQEQLARWPQVLTETNSYVIQKCRTTYSTPLHRLLYHTILWILTNLPSQDRHTFPAFPRCSLLQTVQPCCKYSVRNVLCKIDTVQVVNLFKAYIFKKILSGILLYLKWLKMLPNACILWCNSERAQVSPIELVQFYVA